MPTDAFVIVYVAQRLLLPDDLKLRARTVEIQR